MPTLNRRDLIGSLAASAVLGIVRPVIATARNATTAPAPDTPTTLPNGEVDWRAVRELFPLSTDAIHMATYLFVSTPKPVADKIGSAVLKVAALPEIREKLVQLGFEPTSIDGEKFQRDVAVEVKHWADVIAKAGIKAQ